MSPFKWFISWWKKNFKWYDDSMIRVLEEWEEEAYQDDTITITVHGWVVKDEKPTPG